MWRATETIRLSTRSGGRIGSFGILGAAAPDGSVPVSNWYACRDLFVPHHGQTLRKFLFKIGTESSGANIAAFMDRIETRLKLRVKSSFGPTNRADVIWVRPNAFWRQYSMRRSLLTALLRCSLQWTPDPDNFDQALVSKVYTQQTRPALMYFLEGNTVYTNGTNPHGGWMITFQHVAAGRLPAMLRAPVKPASR